MDKPKIDQIRIKVQLDEDSDSSYLGEYTDEHPGDYELQRGSAFDRKPGRNELRYFVPMNSVEDHRKGLSRLGYSRSQAEDMAREYCRQDYQRMEALNEGQWAYMGITAEARVSYSSGNGSRRLEWLTSSGLWGIESDSGDEYMSGIAKCELSQLQHHLIAFNVDISEFDELAKEALEVADWDF